MYFIILSFIISISAIISILLRQNEKLNLYSLFKPLTTGLIVITSVLVYFKYPSRYAAIMIPSLIFALIGDMCLLNKKYFLYGLSSFLIAHIGFTIGFISLYGFNWNLITLSILSAIFLFYFIFLRKYLEKYFLPVAIYMAVIIVMSWQAIGLISNNDSLIIKGIAISSVLFIISDALIAYKKFVKAFNSIEILILTTYWLAIYVFSIAGLIVYDL